MILASVFVTISVTIREPLQPFADQTLGTFKTVSLAADRSTENFSNHTGIETAEVCRFLENCVLALYLFQTRLNS